MKRYLYYFSGRVSIMGEDGITALPREQWPQKESLTVQAENPYTGSPGKYVFKKGELIFMDEKIMTAIAQGHRGSFSHVEIDAPNGDPQSCTPPAVGMVTNMDANGQALAYRFYGSDPTERKPAEVIAPKVIAPPVMTESPNARKESQPRK